MRPGWALLTIRHPPRSRRRAGRDAAAEGPLRLTPRHALDGGVLLGAEASLAGPADLGQCLLRTACTEAMLWAGPSCARGLTVSLTLPPGMACDFRLVERTEAALVHAGLPPGRLEIGLGSWARLEAAETLLAASALRDMGVGLGLEQADTNPLGRRLPLTSLRLQPGMTVFLTCSQDARRAVAAAIEAAHALDATVVATGVRTAAERDILAALGCDDAQGPLFGPAMPPETFQAALARV